MWERARKLVAEVYRVSATLPISERFGLADQMRRAAISTVANIAEGAGRSSSLDFARFLDISAGSLSELEAHIVLSSDLGYIDHKAAAELNSEIEQLRRMEFRLSERTRKKHAAIG